MAFNPSKLIDSLKPKNLLKACNPDPEKAGNILLVINAMGMVFAALSNTYAAAVDKNTSAEDKKFLVPAGLVTGVANIGLYYAMTVKIIDGLKNSVDKSIKNMKSEDLAQKAKGLIDKKIAKEKAPEVVESMKKLFKNEDGTVTQKAIDLYKDNSKAAAGVLGAFTGAVVGCAILTPIIRDVSAYFVQKYMEKKNPEMKEQPYKPYFEPTRIESARYGEVKKQPLSMKSYMAFTNGGNLKV
ncbi:MAG: hypothetical protein IJW73_03990 [Candidatus Gastranaerophilales bacterium]|nr:hypothetical protein [Candidatus Gastranaerophilales bacterium]